MATSHPIPLFYRILFTYIDPFFCMVGFATHIFSPGQTLQGYSPTFNADKTLPSTSTIHALDSLAAFFVTLALLEGILLRARSHDVGVWRIVQGSVAALDVVMVLAAVRAMSADGRNLGAWRAWRGDDWRLLIGNAVQGIARVACALGVGMGGRGVERTGKVKRG